MEPSYQNLYDAIFDTPSELGAFLSFEKDGFEEMDLDAPPEYLAQGMGWEQ